MKKIFVLGMILMIMISGCSTKVEEVIYDTETVDNATVQENVVEETDETTDSEEEATSEETTVEPLSIRVIAPYGTPVLSMVKMMTENPSVGEGVEVTYEALAATDVLTTDLINHNADIAIVPTNLAAVLHAKEAGYKIAGASVWGVLYIVATEEINSIEDLKGKEISMIGRGLTPDAMMRYILTENGIDPETDLTLNYFSGSSELAADFLGGNSTIAMIPQPLLTAVQLKNPEAKVVLDIQEAWGAITGTPSYPLSSIIVSETLIESHPEVVESFLTEFEASVTWLNENPSEAGAYYEDLDIGLAAPVIQKAIPTSNLTYISATEGRDLFDEYLNVLYNFDPKLTGGKPVDEALYLEK